MASAGAATANRQPTTGGTVTVACKLPNGLILRAFRENMEQEAVIGGGVRDVKIYRPTGDQVLVHGTAVRHGYPPPILFGGYRLTSNVSKDLWDAWYDANKESDLVRNMLVYAKEDETYVQDWSKESAASKSGLEPIDPDAPGKRVRGIEKADGKK